MLTITGLALVLAVQAPDTARTPSGLWYERAGAGPTVLLLHGSNLDSRSWRSLPDSLTGTYRVIAMDLRSHGRSLDAQGPFSWIADVVEVLDHAGAARATLVGHSLGAQIALDVALAHPARVDGLVLIAPGIGGRPATRAPEGIERMVAALRAGDLKQAGIALAEMPVMQLASDSASQNLVRTIVTENTRLFSARPDWVTPLSPPAHERLESIDVPVLVIMGERDPTETNEAGAEILARVRGAKGRTLGGCGHLVPIDCQRGLLDVVREFAPTPRPSGPDAGRNGPAPNRGRTAPVPPQSGRSRTGS